MKICLLSALKDEEGRLTKKAMSHLDTIANLYDQAIILATPDTDTFFGVWEKSDKGPGEARLELLKFASQTDYDFFHYIDFDRLLFWLDNYPNELVRTLELAQNFTVIGRIDQAFRSHPDFQKITEYLCNHLYEQIYGLEYTDFLAGSRIIPRRCISRILERSKQTNLAAMDIEWPMIAGHWDYVEVDGLSYESDYLGIRKDEKDEIKLRMRNLQAVVDMLCD